MYLLIHAGLHFAVKTARISRRRFVSHRRSHADTMILNP
jgi:hypothetical protein